MRILLVNKFWRPLGGVEEHAFLVKRTLEEAGHEVIPFSMEHPENLPDPHDKYFVSSVDFRETTSKSNQLRSVGRATFGVETIRKLRELLRNERIDAAHVLHTYHQMGMTFMLELRRQGIPVILSLHDYKIACPSYRFFSDDTGKICTKCLDHKSGFLWAPTATKCWGGSSTAGLTLSVEATVNRLVGSYRRGPGSVIILNELQRRSVEAAGVDSSKIHLIPHYLELGPEPQHPRESRVLYVGRLVPEKGVDVLIRACASAGLPLRIVGDGRDRETLESLAVSLGADVEFVGPLPQSGVREEMERAGVMAVPSLWHEVSPLVVLESIDAACPVVGTRTGGIPDLIGDGRGVLVAPGSIEELAEALKSVLSDPDESRRMSAQAREYASTEWTRSAWTQRVSAAYAAAGASLEL